MIGFGFAKDWKTLVGLRLILGILEVCGLPGYQSLVLLTNENRAASSLEQYIF